jgi:hypothetical protein
VRCSRLLTPEHPIRFEALALALLDAQRHVKVLSGESRNAPAFRRDQFAKPLRVRIPLRQPT